MTVKEIIQLMANLSIEQDNMIAQEESIFLRYLNLAHFELYEATASVNQGLIENEKTGNTLVANEAFLNKSPFSIVSVFDVSNSKLLKPVSLTNLLHEDANFNRTGKPELYYLQNQVINFYPVQSNLNTINLNCWYVPMPEELKITDNSDAIPYPVFAHQILADGALYYLLNDKDGFNSSQKDNETKTRWAMGKSKLISYFYNRNNIRISTFSNV
jgi:hypothetical protein